jgi:hypothetical protein
MKGESDFGADESDLLDLETDPLGTTTAEGPDAEWERRNMKLQVRTAEVPEANEQRARTREVLTSIENEPTEPSEIGKAEVAEWLKDLPNRVLDHNSFVAYSFAGQLPAWKELLENSPRKSAKSVLSWLRKGFRPRFVGAEGAKQKKRAIVEAMLRKVVPKGKVELYLSGKLPHKVDFENHRSFYTNWGFSKEEVEKLVIWGAASIWDFAEGEPVVINPMGIADLAGQAALDL